MANTVVLPMPIDFAQRGIKKCGMQALLRGRRMDHIKSALDNLARGNAIELQNFVHEVKAQVQIDGTSAVCHFHCINLDGNGQPRIDSLISCLIENQTDYAIPRARIREALDKVKRTGSTAYMNRLLLEASALFTKLAKSGEGGELFLFLLAERFLKLPQLICKMSLKTNSQMHYHGADGLHVGVDETSKKLCLYWGESKLHGSVSTAVSSCFESLAPLLHGKGGQGSPEARDLQLLSQFMDADDPTLEAALKSYLDPDSSNFNALQFRGLCLVGFDSDQYPNTPNTKTVAQVREALESNLQAWSGMVSKGVIKEKLTAFTIHVFMIPFPSVNQFRKSLLGAMGKSA